MASSSSSSALPVSSHSWKYDVFLSFRGEDTRKTFVDHLYSALLQHGIRTYKDDETLPRGESIGPSLEKAIEESEIALIIFSANYAYSSWCLGELAYIMKCKDTRGTKVMPIFYGVEPSTVRKQNHKYGEAFSKHEWENKDKVESWRQALVDASNLSGWDPKDMANGHESKAVREIVETISRSLSLLTSSANKDLIGIEARVQDLISILDIGSGGVCMIGIWGVAGGGKTTLALSVYGEISSRFDGCCCIENIREESSKQGLEKLQETIISNIFKQNKMEVNKVGARWLPHERLRRIKVLIVLDDVDHLDQLEMLVGSHDWFGEGSRIIITTRDKHVLTAHRVNVIYNIMLLNDDEAINLLRKHARRDYRSMADYELLCKDVVSYAGGLPLALKVLGRFLCDKDIKEWRSTLARLKEIRVEDHLLPWILFFTNADLASVGKYSGIQYKARHLMEICDGNLLAIILLARALRGVVKISAWDLAIHEFASQHEPSSTSELGVTGDVMVRVMRFIWSRMERLSQRCIMQFASRYKGRMLDKVSLINSWIRDELVKTEEEGENVFEDLIRSFLIERVGANSVRMRNQIQVIILTHFAPQTYGLYLKEDGSESNRMPTIEEWDAREIHLSNNKISKLPDDPDCPILVSLFLNGNRYLMHIPITFFNNMPSLQALDLSGTSIKSLPSSISKLTTLQKFFIRDCDLLMELPPEIGALKSLKVFDSEGTQLMRLPEEFGLLTKLERLKLSLYNFPDELKQNNPSVQISLAIVLSNLIQLKELVVSVNSYGKWWEDEVKLIINILPKFQWLESLRLYLPTTELVGIFIETYSWHLSNFGFVVGHLKERLISRVPDDLYKTFVKMPKCVTYTNGEAKGDKKVIASVLTNANALFLDRHWTVRSLSAFGLKEMERLKLCLLAECNEMLEIVNGSHLDDRSTSPILGSLEHLSIHYMKSLTCILNKPIDSLCMPNLKTLTIHTCSELRAIFTEGLLDSLACLEYLVVEDCERIKSLVSLESDHLTSSSFLPNLKKISLLDLPELVSISSGISIAPRLESLVVYDCPNLKELSYIEASVEIKGEGEWWDALKWPTGQPEYLDFIPLGTDDDDITDELTDAVNLLPYLGIGESTKEAQTVEIITGPGPTDKGKGKV